MRVLVTGISGQLGSEVMKELRARGAEAIGALREEMPLTDFARCQAYVEKIRPEAVIHCAAYTAVDLAESEPELCHAVNASAVGAIAESCRRIQAKLVYVSTDYVFSGNGTSFYEPEDEKSPCNVYGASKLAGEQAVEKALERFFIVRVSWVFGKNGRNFVRAMLDLAKEQEEISVVSDQFGSPTYAKDAAKLLVDLVETERYGVYHATNEGVCSWAEFAAEIFRQRGLTTRVVPILSSERAFKAQRPKNSRLSKACLERAGFSRLPTWQNALRRYLAELS